MKGIYWYGLLVKISMCRFEMKKFGFVSPEELRRILSCSDVLLYPSRHEGLPLFVLEAMACGCPVVTTEAVKILEDGLDGLICPVEDVDCISEKLHLLLNNRIDGNALTINAHAKVDRFNIDTSKQLFDDTLCRIFNEC